MSILGLTDPWIIGAYALCIITVALCCLVGILGGGRKNISKEDSDSGDEDGGADQ